VGGICPTAEEGVVTCWFHDEYLLDMWVRAPICITPPVRPTLSPQPAPSSPGATPAAPGEGPPACPGALVTVKVFNSVGYETGG